MQSQQTRTIRVPDSFLELTVACAQLFRMELFLHGQKVKLYTFPNPSIGHLSERQRITEENYAEQLTEWRANADKPPPCIFVWSEGNDGTSPNEDYFRKKDASPVRSSPSSSRVSLSTLRLRVRQSSKFRCLACNHNYETAADSLELCHVVELDEVEHIDADAQVALFEECGLIHINDVQNLLLMCSTCHEKFDKQLLGIQIVGGTCRWVVKTALQSTRLPHSSDRTYGTLHDTEVVFPYIVPGRKAIAHRYHNRFLTGISSRSKGGKRKVNRKHTIA